MKKRKENAYNAVSARMSDVVRKFVAILIIALMLLMAVQAVWAQEPHGKPVPTVNGIASLKQSGANAVETVRAGKVMRFLKDQPLPGPANKAKVDELLADNALRIEQRQKFLKEQTEKHKVSKKKQSKEHVKVKVEKIESDTYIVDPPPKGSGYLGGSYGYLDIPAVGLGVPVNYCDRYTSQATVDAWNSAAYMPFWGIPVIGDHSNQEFGPLRSVYSGMIANVWYADGSYDQYICRTAFVGRNTEYDLVDGNGSSCLYASGSLLMYTCLYDSTWESVYITIWDRL